jgi:very-short-patch-repair endonuclease
LPKPAVNAAIYSAGGEWLAEPDLSYEDVRLALEYNGADHADRRQMRRDITRELDMRRRGGWERMVFGPAEVFGRPDQIGLTVREVRRERGARFH